MAKVGVVRFLGTNCDHDVWQACVSQGLTPQWLWFKDNYDPSDYSAIIIPGGFSYGDYLRPGALAAKSPVMNTVREAAKKQIPILGICNGFQILCESQLLPGTLVKNHSQVFIDQWCDLIIKNSRNIWTSRLASTFSMPIAHSDGCYYADSQKLKELRDKDGVWLEYQSNPNGSVEGIAGINVGSVSGLMPHPERATEDWMGGVSGKLFFESLMG